MNIGFVFSKQLLVIKKYLQKSSFYYCTTVRDPPITIQHFNLFGPQEPLGVRKYLKLGLVASGRRQRSATASYLSAPSLRNRLLFENLVGSELDLLPGILYILALAESRADRESYEVRVLYLRRNEMNISRPVDSL